MKPGLTAVRVSLGIAVAVCGLRLLALPAIEFLDLKILDFRTAARGTVRPGGQVVIIGIDEKSLAEVGRWPWPRSRLATLIEKISATEVAVIGVDVILDQPDTSVDLERLRSAIAAEPRQPAAELVTALGLDVDNDARLAAALRDSGRVVLSHFFEFGGVPGPTFAADTERLPELSVRSVGVASLPTTDGLPEADRIHLDVPVLIEAAAGSGHINFMTDPDGIYRRVPVVIRAGDRLTPAIGVEILRRYLGGAAASVTVGPAGVTGVEIGRLAPAVDSAANLWINYLGPPRTFRHISAADVLAGRADPNALTGRIALVGFAAAGFDEIATPFAPVAPAVELQATVLDNILHDGSLRRPWWVVPGEAALVLVFGLGLGLVVRYTGALPAAVAASALALLYVWGTQHLFEAGHLALGAVYPLMGIFLCTLGGTVFQAFSEEREKRWIRGAFSRYLNPEVTEFLARNPERLRLGGERRELTILFMDVRGFSTISEGLSPDMLAELLNEFLGAMTDVVFEHEGLLDKYMGDAVMAFWGAPIAVSDHAARCCRAALGMLTALRELHARWSTLDRPLLEIGVGINTGEAAVGNFGSLQRFSYTALGDDVNLASRLEGLNKTYGTRILISDSTRRVIGEEFVSREIDRVRVKGKMQAVVVHELLGLGTDDHDGSLARRAAAFFAALEAYRQQGWDDAIARLTALYQEYPEDQAVGLLRARCEQLRAVPPGEPWLAVSDALTK